MKENKNYEIIAERNMQALRQTIKEILENREESVGKIEKAIGVSKGYFSRIWKNERTPDIFTICKLVEYLEIDYNLLFFNHYSMSDESELTEEQIIYEFLLFLERKT